MAQQYTSKHTSVNSKKLPAIYSKLWLNQLYKDITEEKPILRYGTPLLYDYGCGKETSHIKRYVERYGFQYVGYDPYYTGAIIMDKIPDVVVCSNVLNVIKEFDIMSQVHSTIRDMNIPYFISIYEGDKSGIGRETKKDCWQRNQPYVDYMTCSEVSKYRIITRPQFIKYISKEHN